MKKKEKKKKSLLGYVLGSAALFGIAVVAIPKILPIISGEVNKFATQYSNAQKDDDDWGPVIEKKGKVE